MSKFTVLRNCHDEVYHVRLPMPEKDAKQLLTGLWETLLGYCPGDPLDETTDRGRCVRTSFSHRDGVAISTHSWLPEHDTDRLHQDVIDYLCGRGLEVESANG